MTQSLKVRIGGELYQFVPAKDFSILTQLLGRYSYVKGGEATTPDQPGEEPDEPDPDNPGETPVDPENPDPGTEPDTPTEPIVPDWDNDIDLNEFASKRDIQKTLGYTLALLETV